MKFAQLPLEWQDGVKGPGFLWIWYYVAAAKWNVQAIQIVKLLTVAGEASQKHYPLHMAVASVRNSPFFVTGCEAVASCSCGWCGKHCIRSGRCGRDGLGVGTPETSTRAL